MLGSGLEGLVRHKLLGPAQIQIRSLVGGI